MLFRSLRADILPQDLLEQATGALSNDDPLRPYLDKCINEKVWNDEDLMIARQRFAIFTKKLDALRSESCVSLVPQLADMLS